MLRWRAERVHWRTVDQIQGAQMLHDVALRQSCCLGTCTKQKVCVREKPT